MRDSKIVVSAPAKPAVRLATMRSATALALVLAFGVAVWMRYELALQYGGAGDYLQWADANYFGGISRFYVQSAIDLAAGRPYVSLAYPPGYSMVLSSFVRGGASSANGMRVAQIVLDSVTVFAMFGLTRLAGFSAAAAIGAAWVYALHPLWAAGAVFLLGESLTPLLCVWLLLAVAQATRRGRTAWWAVAGMLAGATILIRPDLLILAAILALAGFLTPVSGLRRAGAFIAGIAMLLGPWGVHNRLDHGQWVFTSSSSGAALYEGLGDVPNAYGYVADDSVANHLLMAQGLRNGPGTPEANAFLLREYRRALVVHPGHVLRAAISRWRAILFTSERIQPLYFGRLRQLADVVGPVALLVALFLVRRQPLLILILTAPLVSALFGIGLTHYEPRYVRYVQLSYVFAGFVLLERGCRELWPRVPRRIAVIAIGVAGAALAVYSAKQLVDIHRAAAAALTF